MLAGFLGNGRPCFYSADIVAALTHWTQQRLVPEDAQSEPRSLFADASMLQSAIALPAPPVQQT